MHSYARTSLNPLRLSIYFFANLANVVYILPFKVENEPTPQFLEDVSLLLLLVLLIKHQC